MGAVKAAIPHLSSADAATRRSSVMLVNSLAQLGTICTSLLLLRIITDYFVHRTSSVLHPFSIFITLKRCISTPWLYIVLARNIFREKIR